MAKPIAKLDPKRFNLKSFADLLSSRSVIIGEEPGDLRRFTQG